ncbi:MAG: iron uptake porin [Spirulina sp. SIO3F2]|nr:iron uptake porin [Spirulina sp. SIO3F2]
MPNLRKYLPAVLGSSLLMAQPLAANAQSTQDVLNSVQNYSDQGYQSFGQGVGAAQFSDVSPSDWAYQALDDLVRRYDCLKGYPNGTFRGNRALSRYEFAAGLNACMQQIERLIAETTADFVTREDLETLQRLMQDFEAELNALGARVDALESRVSFLEDNQFSTTTKFKGEVLFAAQQAFYGGQFDNEADGNRIAADGEGADEITFGYRARLRLNTSFNGKDQLGLRLATRNIQDFDVRGSFANEARTGYRGVDPFEIDQVFYTSPLGDRASIQVWANGAGRDDILTVLNPFASSGGGAISRFGQRNPFIYRGTGEQAAVGIGYDLTDDLKFEVGYMAGEASVATHGIFSGDYAIPAQITYDNGDLALAASFVHGFSRAAGLDHGTGSNASGVDIGAVPTTNNSYGLEALYNVSDSFFVGAWAGYANAIVQGTGSADVWNYALTLGFPDLGGDGNQLGFIFGRQPYLAYAEGGLAGNTALDLSATDSRSDPDVGWHLEAFYRIKLTDGIDITPGLFLITAPNNNDNNPSVLVGAIRTRFKF